METYQDPETGLKLNFYAPRECEELFSEDIVAETTQDGDFLAAMETRWSEDAFSDDPLGNVLSPYDAVEMLELDEGTYELDESQDLVLILEWPADIPAWLCDRIDSDSGTDPWDFSG